MKESVLGRRFKCNKMIFLSRSVSLANMHGRGKSLGAASLEALGARPLHNSQQRLKISSAASFPIGTFPVCSPSFFFPQRRRFGRQEPGGSPARPQLQRLPRAGDGSSVLRGRASEAFTLRGGEERALGTRALKGPGGRRAAPAAARPPCCPPPRDSATAPPAGAPQHPGRACRARARQAGRGGSPPPFPTARNNKGHLSRRPGNLAGLSRGGSPAPSLGVPRGAAPARAPPNAEWELAGPAVQVALEGRGPEPVPRLPMKRAGCRSFGGGDPAPAPPSAAESFEGGPDAASAIGPEPLLSPQSGDFDSQNSPIGKAPAGRMMGHPLP